MNEYLCEVCGRELSSSVEAHERKCMDCLDTALAATLLADAIRARQIKAKVSELPPWDILP